MITISVADTLRVLTLVLVVVPSTVRLPVTTRSPTDKLFDVVLPLPVIVSRVSDSAVRYAGVKFSHFDVDELYLIRSPVTVSYTHLTLPTKA